MLACRACVSSLLWGFSSRPRLILTFAARDRRITRTPPPLTAVSLHPGLVSLSRRGRYLLYSKHHCRSISTQLSDIVIGLCLNAGCRLGRDSQEKCAQLGGWLGFVFYFLFFYFSIFFIFLPLRMSFIDRTDPCGGIPAPAKLDTYLPNSIHHDDKNHPSLLRFFFLLDLGLGGHLRSPLASPITYSHPRGRLALDVGDGAERGDTGSPTKPESSHQIGWSSAVAGRRKGACSPQVVIASPQIHKYRPPPPPPPPALQKPSTSATRQLRSRPESVLSSVRRYRSLLSPPSSPALFSSATPTTPPPSSRWPSTMK